MFLTKYIQLRETVLDFARKQDGVTAIEYALVGVAVAVIVGVVFGSNGELKGALDEGMKSIKAAMSTSTSTT